MTEGGTDEAGVFHLVPRIDDARLEELFVREVLDFLVRRELLSPEWAERFDSDRTFIIDLGHEQCAETDNLERLKKALRKVFPADDEIDSLSLRDLQDYALVRYGTADDFYIDLIAGIGEMFRYEDLEYEIRDVAGAQVRIATPETLLRMKKDTVRPEDRRDARFLAELVANRASEK